MLEGTRTQPWSLQAQRECEEIVAQTEAHATSVAQMKSDAAAAEERRNQAQVQTLP